MPQLRSETEWVKHFRNKSAILNPQNMFDNQGRPTSSKSFSFSDQKEYLEELLSKRHDPFGPKGLIEIAKEKLRTSKAEWQYRMKARNQDIKTPPLGQPAIEINRLSAQLKVYREEARTINSRLQQTKKIEDQKLIKKQKKFAYQGMCKLANGKVCRCDHRGVEDGKFTDNGESLSEYLIEVKQRKREQALAQAKVQRDEIAQRKRAEINEIESRKIAIDNQLRKIRRRQAPSQPA